MARPIAQHPPSALQFPSASRPSTLGFGFASSTARSPFADVANANMSTSVSFNPFGSPIHSPADLQRKAFRPRPVLASTSSAPPRVLKRSRYSTSPSPPGSPASATSSSPNAIGKRSSHTRSKDLPTVDDLALSANNRVAKKVKQVPEGTINEDLDMGLMLATLPTSTHLQILLSLMQKDPGIQSQILAVTPTPDLNNCNDELLRIMERIFRQYGEPGEGRYHLGWSRAEREITGFCKTAMTYLAFFYSSRLNAAVDLTTLHNLLFSVTKSATNLVRLLPPRVEQSAATTSLSQLANTLVLRWREWVTTISSNVNEKGEIYPHSTVVSWAQNFRDLVDVSRTRPEQCPDPEHITGLIHTISTIRDTFAAQVGWLIGPGGGMR